MSKIDAKEGSHDTILMLFQNPSSAEVTSPPVISVNDVPNQQKLKSSLPCQEIIPAKTKCRATLPKNYATSTVEEPMKPVLFSQHQVWLIMRFLTGRLISSSSVIKKYLPSFSAVKSLMITRNVTLTHEAYSRYHPTPCYRL